MPGRAKRRRRDDDGAQIRPDAITLDLTLPGIHGYAVLDRLKHDPSTRHIPVQIISAIDDMKRILKLGAFGHISKPASREQIDRRHRQPERVRERPEKRLLLVEDDEVLRNSMVELIGGGDIKIVLAGTGEEALEELRKEKFDCAIVDLMLPDMEWSELIGKIKRESGYPGAAGDRSYRQGPDQTRDDTIKKLAETVIIKDADSMERLVDETALFLHRDVANLTESQKNMMRRVNLTDPRLEGKKVLVVDDDIRNIFALTSVLERQKMEVVYAENGNDGSDS